MYFRLLIRDGILETSRPTTTGVTRFLIEKAAPRKNIKLELSIDSFVSMTKISSALFKAALKGLLSGPILIRFTWRTRCFKDGGVHFNADVFQPLREILHQVDVFRCRSDKNSISHN
jgi:hypothetical protein